ncbi:MAG TPA: MaoC family dehydratase [Candidatus Limnocylindrales bacterium]|nr:MaoC family dehydratase [Candidatus Limnocylindrales bacterium]
MIGITIGEIHVGDHAEIARVAGDADIAGFVAAVGDANPIHSDPDYAARTMFGERIAPGIWTAGLISAVIGTRLPGPGTIYLSQDLRFVKPVKLGDAVRARVEVIEVDAGRNRVRLRTVCTNQRGDEVLVGDALVMPSRTQVVYEAPSAASLMAFWTLAPLVWAAEGAALGMVGLAALAGAAPVRYMKSPPLMESSAPVM